MKRIPSLDGLRAISISLVILGHWTAKHHEPTFLSVYANLGVRVFFVISGYLITTLLLTEQRASGRISLPDFYLRRAYRIFPAAFAFIIPVLALRWRELHWYDAAAAGFYLMNFDFAAPWFLGHLWSLSVEEQFYFLWPALLKKSFRYRVPLLGGLLALAPIYSSGCYLLKIPGGGYGTLPAVADNLAVGCLLAISAARAPRIGRISAFAMLMAVLLIPQFAADTRGRSLVMLFALWPGLHLAVAGLILHVIQNPYKILNIAPIVFLGRISYSLYLWQQLFFFRPEPWPAYVALPLALGFASASYFLVEQPMLRLRDARQDAAIRARLHFVMAGD